MYIILIKTGGRFVKGTIGSFEWKKSTTSGIKIAHCAFSEFFDILFSQIFSPNLYTDSGNVYSQKRI